VATGVAHDFNNLLTAIMGYAEIVRDTLGPEHPCTRDVDQVLSAGRRAEALARQLLSFSRTQRRRTDFVDVNQVVTGFVPLLKRLVGDEIQIELSSAPVPAVVRADRGQLELVIMNLAVNARDAMNGSGRIAIGIEIDDPGAERPAGTVSLIVTDSGTGVPANVKAHVFEPFVTTTSNGTGLGLATVHDIVVESGGTVEVGRDAGGGARFRVRLPAAPADADTLELPVGDALRAGIGR
jgi:signal transduction histidine kinase